MLFRNNFIFLQLTSSRRDMLQRDAAKQLILSVTESRLSKRNTDRDKEDHPHLVCLGAPGTGFIIQYFSFRF